MTGIVKCPHKEVLQLNFESITASYIFNSLLRPVIGQEKPMQPSQSIILKKDTSPDHTPFAALSAI